MTTSYIQNNTEHTHATCGNCGERWKIELLDPISDLEQRLEPGGEVPAGQCPDETCGALCYVERATAPPPVAFRELRCDMGRGCGATPTHIGEKGWLYCAEHAPQRSGYERTRKLRPWEFERLRAGKVIGYERQSRRAFEARHGA